MHGTIETPGRADGELLLRPYTEERFQKFARDSRDGNTAHQVMWSWCRKRVPVSHECLAACVDYCNHCRHCSSHCNSHGEKLLPLQVEPDDSVYARLPEYDYATDKFFLGLAADNRMGVLQEVRELIERHGLEEVVAVDLKHRHFQMPSGHVLLEERHIEAQESVMKAAPFTVPMIPFAFVLSDGAWKPYEFVHVECESAVHGLELVRNNLDFLGEMRSLLMKHGLEDILGIHILHREHLGLGTHGTIETPGRAGDELLLRPYTEERFQTLTKGSKEGDKTYHVMWSWCACGKHLLVQ